MSQGGQDGDRLQKNGGNLVNIVQSNREIRPRGEKHVIGAKAQWVTPRYSLSRSAFAGELRGRRWVVRVLTCPS